MREQCDSEAQGEVVRVLLVGELVGVACVCARKERERATVVEGLLCALTCVRERRATIMGMCFDV